MSSLHLRLAPKLTRQQTQLAGTVSFARLTAVVAAGIRRSGRPTPQLRVTLATLSVLFLCVFCSTAHTGATITVSAPAAGATVNCAVTVAASMSFTGTDQQKGPVTFYFVDSFGNQVPQGGITGNPVLWNSMQAANGTVSIYATVPYGSGYSVYTANSAIITVTVKKGYDLSTDAAQTFAKVNSPTSGQVVPTDGSQFTVNTDHQITWTRYDGCQPYAVSYGWKQSTTWKALTAVVDPQDGSMYNIYLPLQTGPFSVRKLGWVNTYVGSFPTGAFTADAYCYAGSTDAVAHGSANFTVATPK